MQSGGRHTKWESSTRLGMKMGPSPRNASLLDFILNIHTGLISPQFHIYFENFFNKVRLSRVNLPTFSQCQLVSGIKVGKVKRVLPSEVEHIYSELFIPTREETIGDERDARADAETHQQDTHDQSHASEDQYSPQYSSHLNISAIIGEMVYKVRYSNNPSRLFTSTHKSNK